MDNTIDHSKTGCDIRPMSQEESSSQPCKSNPFSDFTACLYEKENAPYISPTPGEFPIIAYNPFPDETKTKLERVDKVMECGFNAGVFFSSSEAMGDALRVSAQRGFKMIIAVPPPKRNNLDYEAYCEAFFNEWKRFVSNEKYDSVTDKVYDLLFRKSPALGCWSIQDEPIYNFLSSLGANYESLRSLDTAHMFYTNLLGSTLEAQYCGSELQNKPYIRYLELIQETMRPPVWSYDLYPMRKYYKNNAWVWGIMFKEFYEALEAASRMAMLTHRPFWAFCQSAEYITLYSSTTKDDLDEICQEGKCKFMCPPATLEYLRYEAFSALAYGAQGICYWTYWLTPGLETEIHPSALVDNNGVKSESWYYARQVNGEIKALTDVFLGCTLMRVRHTGNDANINSVTCPLTTAEPMWPLESASSSGSGLLVSHLSNKGRDYLVIVSHDPLNSQTVSLKFRNHWTVRTVNPIAEVKKFTKSDDGTRTVYSGTLPAGGYIVFEWS